MATSFDFSKIIDSMVQQGASIEDIAKGMTDALNASRKKQEEDKKKTMEDNVQRTRNAYYETLKKTFKMHYDSDKLFLSDLGILAAIIVWDEHPEWGIDDFEELITATTDIIKARITMIGKDGFTALRDVLYEMLKDAAMPKDRNTNVDNKSEKQDKSDIKIEKQDVRKEPKGFSDDEDFFWHFFGC